MSSTVGPNIGLEHSWAAGESGWKPGMDANLKKLDALVFASVVDKDLSTPPGSPVDGVRYIVGPTATGAWTGKETQFAVYDGPSATWLFYPPKDGWLVWVSDENKIYVYDSAAWTLYANNSTTGQTRKLWLPASAFGYNLNAIGSSPSTPGVGRSSPLDDKSWEFIYLPAAGDTYLHTWWKVPDDFVSLVGWDIYLVARGSSTTNLSLWWSYAMAALNDQDADNGAGYGNMNLTVAPSASNRMVIKTGITLPAGPPTITAGSVAKMEIERVNANDANPDDYRFLGILMRYVAG